jgi:transposase
VVGDKAHDADWIRAQIKEQGAVANIPNKANRIHRYRFKKALYRERNLIERFFNRIKPTRGLRDSRPQRSNPRRDSAEMWSILYRLDHSDQATIVRLRANPCFTSPPSPALRPTLCRNLKKLMRSAIG